MGAAEHEDHTEEAELGFRIQIDPDEKQYQINFMSRRGLMMIVIMWATSLSSLAEEWTLSKAQKNTTKKMAKAMKNIKRNPFSSLLPLFYS